MTNIKLRPAVPSDLETVLALNQAEAKWTSNLSASDLAQLAELADFFVVAEHQGHVVGFVLVMTDTSAYDNANLRWFGDRFMDFWYVDRIVVAKSMAGAGLGRMIYEHCAEGAKAAGKTSVVCEYSTQPMNEPSAAFHARMGFCEVGSRVDATNNKHLSMQRWVF